MVGAPSKRVVKDDLSWCYRWPRPLFPLPLQSACSEGGLQWTFSSARIVGPKHSGVAIPVLTRRPTTRTASPQSHSLTPFESAPSPRGTLSIVITSVESQQTIDVVGLHDRVGELERESETFATAGQAREAAFQATVNASAHIYSSEYSAKPCMRSISTIAISNSILDVFSFCLWG